MVKQRIGSRKGRTKINKAAYKAAKKRAARTGKATAPAHVVTHPVLQANWDATKKPAENLAAAGLLASVNYVQKRSSTTRRIVTMGPKPGSDAAAALADISVVESLAKYAAVPERGADRVVRPGEKVALTKLVDKYGSDYVRMARDIKLNYLQWTPAQLQKRIERMQDIIDES